MTQSYSRAGFAADDNYSEVERRMAHPMQVFLTPPLPVK